MGNRMSRIVVGCFSSERHHEKYTHGLHFSEPLDEGLGHSFCYVRPVLVSPTTISRETSPQHTNISSPPLDFTSESTTTVDTTPETTTDSQQIGVVLSEELQTLEADATLRPRVVFEKPKHNERTKSLTETSFKAISGASVSANTATPRSVASQEQFNSFSNVPIERAAAFESTASFSALPLQRITNSGPISGPLLSASGPLLLQSGPLERGFMSGPLERGFMSGPIERGFMSGPLEPVDRNTFSAPLSGRGNTNKKSSLKRFVRSMSLPMRKAIAKTTATLTRTIVLPVRHFVMGDNNRENAEFHPQSSFDSPFESSGSDLDSKDDDNNLQWAQGKAGEDRVHVVLSEEHGWLFVGIYDGFNGPDATDFLMSNLYPAIYRELKGLLWNQKSAFELGDASSSGDGEDDDFVSRLGHSSSCSSDVSQKECVSTLQESPEEVAREDLGCHQARNPKPADVVDLRPGDIGNCCGQPSCEVDTIHGDELENHSQDDKHIEEHGKFDLSARESKCDLGLELEQERKLVEDRIDTARTTTQEGCTEQDLFPSIVSQVDTPEPIASSTIHFPENTPVKDHSILNMKLQVLHNRRREQHRKYPQWR